MPKSRSFSALIDYAHGEILNLSDTEFKPFADLLNRSGCSLTFNRSGKITEDSLDGIVLLIIGCPVNHHLSQSEIKLIVNFVMAGGCLLSINEYGGDSIQKTNLNELMKYFGIYFEETTVRTENTTNTGSSSLPLITDIAPHEVSKNVRKIILGGCCSIRVAKEAFGLCFSGRDTWIDVYDDINNSWVKNDEISIPLIAGSVYGQGRVIAIGDIDIFGANPRFGIEALDNKRLIQNIFNWFNQPVRSELTIEWILTQISVHREDILKNSENFTNLIDTIKILEKRITNIENIQDKMQEQIFKQSQLIHEKFKADISLEHEEFDNTDSYINTISLDSEIEEISEEDINELK